MKRFASFVLMFIMVASLCVGMSITVFATEEQAPESGEQVKLTWDDLGVAINNIDLTNMDSIKAAYNTLTAVLKGYYNDVVTLIKSNKTYSEIATAVLGILAFIAFPIIVGLIVVVYVAIGAMILFAGALTAIVELVLGMVSTIVPL